MTDWVLSIIYLLVILSQMAIFYVLPGSITQWEMWTEEYLFWPGKKLINNSTILRVSNDAKTSAKTKLMSKL